MTPHGSARPAFLRLWGKPVVKCPVVSWVASVALKLITSWGSSCCLMEEPHLLIVLLISYQLLSWRGRVLHLYDFGAHGCPWQSVENHFVSLTGICFYIGTERMVWLSSNYYYEWHPRLWQRPLVLLGKGYGLARLELRDLLGTVACHCATVVQSVEGWQYTTYLGKALWCKRALQAKAHNVSGRHITYAVRWDLRTLLKMTYILPQVLPFSLAVPQLPHI